MSNNKNELKMVALGDITPSATNPRKHFDAAKLNDLAASIRDSGVLNPLTVRTRHGASGKFEIVAGERRWRAAKLAKLATVPVLVRELSDLEVLQIQMIENLQRDDLTVLEEARGYEQMLALSADGKPVYTVATLAAAIGKSERHVIDRRQLARLKGAGLDALVDGRITMKTALVLCRVQNESVLAEVVKEVLHPEYQNEPLGAVATMELIAERFTRTLKGVAFDVKDAALVPRAGACLGCTKCSTSNSEFFGAVAEMCYDIACFKSKQDADWQRRTRGLPEDVTVLAQEDDKPLFNVSELSWRGREKFVDLAEKPAAYEMADGVKAAKWEKLLKGVDVPKLLARDERGAPHVLVEKNIALAALQQAGKPVLKNQSPARDAGGDYQRQKREEREQAAARELAAHRAVSAMLARMMHSKDGFYAPKGLWLDVYRYVLRNIAQTDGCAFLGKCYGLERAEKSPSAWGDALLADAKGKGDAELMALTVVALISRWVKYNGAEDEELQTWSKLYGVPLAAIVKEAKAETEKSRQPKLPLPPNVTLKILKAWLLKHHPDRAVETWVTISHDDRVRDEFVAFVEDTASKAADAKNARALKGKVDAPLPQGEDIEKLKAWILEFLPPEFAKIHPAAVWARIDRSQQDAFIEWAKKIKQDAPKSRRKKAADADEPADGEAGEGDADDDAAVADGEAKPALQFQIPLGEIATVEDDDERLAMIAAFPRRDAGSLINKFAISRAAAIVWLKRLATREMGEKKS